MSKSVLSVENVTMQFGGVVAVDNLNLEVNEGEIVALIGPNGAGKTTAFNVITGVYAPTNGRVRFNEACIVRNHPSGKMKKQYKGEHADMYTAQFAPEEALDDEALKAWKEGQKALDSYAFTDHVLAPTPDKITRWVWPVPSRISVCGRPRRCLTMCLSPSICGAPAICLPRRST